MDLYNGDHHRYVLFRQSHSTATNPRTGHTVFWDDSLGKGYDGRNLTNSEADLSWLNHSLGQTKGAEMYTCPEDLTGNLRDFDSGREGYENIQKNAKPRSYSINAYSSWNGTPNHSKQAFAGIEYRTRNQGVRGIEIWSQSISRVINPSKVFLIVEHPGTGWVGAGGGAATGNIPSQSGFYDIRWWKNRRSSTVEFNNTKYHHEGWNYLFADGHVQNMEEEDTKGSNGTDFNPRGYWSIKTTD